VGTAISLGKSNGAGGQVFNSIYFGNHSAMLCRLDGTATIVLRFGEGRGAVPFARGSRDAFSGSTSALFLISIFTTVALSLVALRRRRDLCVGEWGPCGLGILDDFVEVGARTDSYPFQRYWHRPYGPPGAPSCSLSSPAFRLSTSGSITHRCFLGCSCSSGSSASGSSRSLTRRQNLS
jgi:hypothetical protein